MARAKRPLRVDGAVAFVPLTQGMEAVIDVYDVPLVCAHNWSANKSRGTHYAGTKIVLANGDRTNCGMHRMILGAPVGLQVDHVDGNGLNNRRSNLRLATASENGRNRGPQRNNRSGYKGVSRYEKGLGWRADIWLNGSSNFLGSFRTPEEAHAAYCKAATLFHGEFSWPNLGARDFAAGTEAA